MEESPRGDTYSVVYQGEVSAVIDILAEGHTPQKAIEVAQNACLWLDRFLGLYDHSSPIACRAKCAWCCYVGVDCTPPEAVAVATYVKTRFTRRARAGVMARLVAADDQTHGLDADARNALRLACPFLEDNVCLVHKARPLACRGWHSFDVHQCKQSWEQRSAGGVSVSLERVGLRGIVSQAIVDGLKASGLVADRIELNAAVRLVLEQPDVVTSWLVGKDAFCPARSAAPTAGQAEEWDRIAQAMAGAQDSEG